MHVIDDAIEYWGMAAANLVSLLETGVPVIWRSHVGLDVPNERAREAWRFLIGYMERADAYVFSRPGYTWEGLDEAKALEAKFGEPRKSALLWKPQNTVAVDDEAGEKILKLMEALDETFRIGRELDVPEERP